MTHHVRPEVCEPPEIADAKQAANAVLHSILRLPDGAGRHASNLTQEYYCVKTKNGKFADCFMFTPDGISWWVYVSEGIGCVFGVTSTGELFEAAASFRAVTKDRTGARVVTQVQAQKVATWLLEREDSPPVLLCGE